MKRTIEKPVNKLLANARRRAKKRGQTIELTHAWVQKRLDQGHCEITGLPFFMGNPGTHEWWTHPRAPSLHRVDPNKGYTRSNTRLVVWQYNCAINHWPEDYLTELAFSIMNL